MADSSMNDNIWHGMIPTVLADSSISGTYWPGRLHRDWYQLKWPTPVWLIPTEMADFSMTDTYKYGGLQ